MKHDCQSSCPLTLYSLDADNAVSKLENKIFPFSQLLSLGWKQHVITAGQDLRIYHPEKLKSHNYILQEAWQHMF
jgi:hypothetical protein